MDRFRTSGRDSPGQLVLSESLRYLDPSAPDTHSSASPSLTDRVALFPCPPSPPTPSPESPGPMLDRSETSSFSPYLTTAPHLIPSTPSSLLRPSRTHPSHLPFSSYPRFCCFRSCCLSEPLLPSSRLLGSALDLRMDWPNRVRMGKRRSKNKDKGSESPWTREKALTVDPVIFLPHPSEKLL